MRARKALPQKFFCKSPEKSLGFVLGKCKEHENFRATKRNFQKARKNLPVLYWEVREVLNHSEMEVLQMQEKMDAQEASGAPNLDEELADVLIAISVIAKRLAKKLVNQSKESEEQTNE